MTVLLITALQAAETLGAYHRQRVDQTLGARQQWHAEMAMRCEENIEDIRQQLAAHLLPEWRASEKASQAIGGVGAGDR